MVQRAFRAQIIYRRTSPVLLQMSDISLHDVSTSFGGLPSVQVVCHLEDGEGKKSREAGTLIERNNACPSFDDFTLSIKLPGCAYAPLLSICVYSDMGELVATKDIKIYGSETMLQHLELEATPPVRNCRISAKIRLFRGIASIMFSSELKEQVKRKQMLREMGPTVAELVQRDIDTGLIAVYGPAAASSGSRSVNARTKRFCMALAARCKARVLFLPSLIAQDCRSKDFGDGGSGGRILSDLERQLVLAKGNLPARRLVKIVESARMRMESTEPAVLVNFPSTVAELDEIEDRNMTQDLGMQMKPSLLAAFQLYTLGDKLCPAAARLGREGRLSVLLADPNRKGRGGLSFAPQLAQAIKVVASAGLRCSEEPYPSAQEANEIIANAARNWLHRRKRAKQQQIVDIFLEPIPTKELRDHAMRWTERAKHRTKENEEKARRRLMRHLTPNSFRRDAMLSGRNKASRFLDGSVPPLTKLRIENEYAALSEHMLALAKRNPDHRMLTRRTQFGSGTAPSSPSSHRRLTFFSPTSHLYHHGYHVSTTLRNPSQHNGLYVLKRPASARAASGAKNAQPPHDRFALPRPTTPSVSPRAARTTPRAVSRHRAA